MGIGNNELVEYEQNNASELVPEFIKEHWKEFCMVKEVEGDYDLKLFDNGFFFDKAEEFCTNHKEWGDFVQDGYTDECACLGDSLLDEAKEREILGE